MTTQVHFDQGISHMLSYCFGTVQEHITMQSKSKKTPFSLYMKNKHNELKQKCPDISERSKKIGKLWKSESDEVKEKYKLLSEQYCLETHQEYNI